VANSAGSVQGVEIIMGMNGAERQARHRAKRDADCRTHPALRNVARRLVMEAQFILLIRLFRGGGHGYGWRSRCW
jgi:hypothetical protein